MLQTLKIVLDIQEFDMKMIRLMRLKKERLKELEHIDSLRQELLKQQSDKELEIAELNRTVASQEARIVEIKDKIKKLEAKQNSVKKVDEFNALTHEMTSSERERIATELITSDMIDKRNLEEEILEKIKESLGQSEESSRTLENEIRESIRLINQEGSDLKGKRDVIAQTADPEIMRIYERLLNNKKDRVVVPIENRTCSGCHIALTAQHENLVRKGERLVFCEHCSRIHYWQESQEIEGTAVATKRRRRRLANV
ncbi:MAG TPA: C4-type zinc ribbon domain-containing protein [Chlamydiales bacterium]|nr:C4-type zinc ribbon domain-containing protein [Chlamydiales bacterium]